VAGVQQVLHQEVHHWVVQVVAVPVVVRPERREHQDKDMQVEIKELRLVLAVAGVLGQLVAPAGLLILLEEAVAEQDLPA